MSNEFLNKRVVDALKPGYDAIAEPVGDFINANIQNGAAVKYFNGDEEGARNLYQRTKYLDDGSVYHEGLKKAAGYLDATLLAKALSSALATLPIGDVSNSGKLALNIPALAELAGTAGINLALPEYRHKAADTEYPEIEKLRDTEIQTLLALAKIGFNNLDLLSAANGLSSGNINKNDLPKIAKDKNYDYASLKEQ